ncbi:hypothetical protein IFM89_005651 [Coptis chinensis]|uniref:Uncharacterized protein n=1 Tax=Coptis chinensis TaxID=261450 RepID=A0A835IVC1_9MAGN|nr:hypothetical protein IFM89_005651 [Coptis chinensis]
MRHAVHPLQLGQSCSKKVEKQCAHFYSVDITEQEAQAGLVCRVQSSDKSKFKLLYFEPEDNGGLSLALQEESAKIGKCTSAGMYFLGFPVYRHVKYRELKAGTHVFSVYGRLRLLDLWEMVLAQFTEMTSRYAQEMQANPRRKNAKPDRPKLTSNDGASAEFFNEASAVGAEFTLLTTRTWASLFEETHGSDAKPSTSWEEAGASYVVSGWDEEEARALLDEHSPIAPSVSG